MALPYFPATYGYPNLFAQQAVSTQYGIQPPQNGLIAAWVQGEQAMKSFAMGPNQKAFLFNTEENNFGIKTTDANGMPNPLEMFAYHRIDTNTKQPTAPVSPSPLPNIDVSSFVTKEELDSRLLDLMIEFENKGTNQNVKGDVKHGK